jgi:hypothetical protein
MKTKAIPFDPYHHHNGSHPDRQTEKFLVRDQEKRGWGKGRERGGGGDGWERG